MMLSLLLVAFAFVVNAEYNNKVSAEQLPLSVKGRYVVDSSGNRVKLACVNWYGAEELDFVVGGLQWQTISTISGLISSYGFNCIRLPFSLELIDKNPVIKMARFTFQRGER